MLFLHTPNRKVQLDCMIFFYVNVILLETFNFLFFQLCKDKVAESIHMCIQTQFWQRFVRSRILFCGTGSFLIISKSHSFIATQIIHSLPRLCIHSLILQFVVRKVHSFLQSEFSTQCFHPPHLALRLKKEWSYTCIPLWTFVVCFRVSFTFDSVS